MGMKALALGVAAVGVVSLEVLNLYKQVMGRNDRPEMPMTKLAKKADADMYAQIDEWKEPYGHWAENRSPEKCTISSDRGDLLCGYYWKPTGDSKVVVIGSHGFHVDHKGDPYTFIKHYCHKGYAFFCPDHVGSSSSGGKYVGFDYYESQDLLLWIDYLKAKLGDDIIIILHGVSMGASTVLKLAGKKCPDNVKLIISDCAFTCATDEFIHVAKTAGVKNPQPIYTLMNGINKRLAGFDLAKTDVRQSVKNAKVPILFIHGGSDDFVPTKMVYELYDLCPADKKEIKVFDNAGHAQSLFKNEDEYLNTVDDFISRRLIVK